MTAQPEPLVAPGESPEQTLARLERRPDYHRLTTTAEGQRLLEVIRRQDKARRRNREVQS